MDVNWTIIAMITAQQNNNTSQSNNKRWKIDRIDSIGTIYISNLELILWAETN